MIIEQQTPTENLDYTINWTTRGLGTDTIATSTWVVSPNDLTSSNPSNTTTTTTIWLTGGTAGNFYTVTNTITTAGGREMQETFTMNIVAQRFI